MADSAKLFVLLIGNPSTEEQVCAFQAESLDAAARLLLNHLPRGEVAQCYEIDTGRDGSAWILTKDKPEVIAALGAFFRRVAPAEFAVAVMDDLTMLEHPSYMLRIEEVRFLSLAATTPSASRKVPSSRGPRDTGVRRFEGSRSEGCGCNEATCPECGPFK